MPTEPEWINLVQRMSVVETFVSELRNNHIPHIRDELTWIKERLNRGYRPPWTLVTLISFLSALCVGLLVAIIK